MKEEQILTKNGLRITLGRKLVLRHLLQKNNALSHSYLEEELKQKLDRVTIYRTLHSFLEKGIIHKVLDEGGSSKYALCATCDHEKHSHDHVHFKCEKCGDTTCINEIHIPSFQLPAGYLAKEIGILVQGICKTCNNI